MEKERKAKMAELDRVAQTLAMARAQQEGDEKKKLGKKSWCNNNDTKLSWLQQRWTADAVRRSTKNGSKDKNNRTVNDTSMRRKKLVSSNGSEKPAVVAV